jgi:hypothetical protein
MRLFSAFLILQLTEDWYSDNMGTVTNKKKVLSVEEDKVTRQIENGK